MAGANSAERITIGKTDQLTIREMVAGLNPNLADPTNLRDAISHRCYPQIFGRLIMLPREQQLARAQEAFQLVNIPHPVPLARELISIINIDGDFYKPHDITDIEQVEESAKTLLETFKFGDLMTELKVIRDLQEARQASVATVAMGIALDVTRRGMWQTARDQGIDQLIMEFIEAMAKWTTSKWAFPYLGDELDPIEISVMDLMFTQVEDAAPIPNPFALVMNMYENGAQPIGVDGNQFLVYCPSR